VGASPGRRPCEEVEDGLPDGDCLKIGGQAAIAVCGSMAGWNFCRKSEPNVPF
jgi:hypothetical protein